MNDIVKGISAYEDDEFGHAMQSILHRAFSFEALRTEMTDYGLIDVADDDYSAHHIWANGLGSQQGTWNRIPEGAVRIDGGWSTETAEFLDDQRASTDWFRDVPEGAVRTSEGYSVRTGNRRREESIEERALRRRRREAVVVGRNGQPIQHVDIIQRETTVLDEEVEEELEQLMEEVTEAQSIGERGWWGVLSRLRPNGLAPVAS